MILNETSIDGMIDRAQVALDLKINSLQINAREELGVLVNMYDATRYQVRQCGQMYH